MENPTQPQTPNTRTFMCAVVFLDIVEYSKKPVARQLIIKQRFNAIVGKGLENVPASDRIILDTGDGAALCFLGDPEDALFVTNAIRNEFAAETIVPELQVRLGINLGPVKVMRDLNGNPNIVGDGINVAQRVMSFAQTNQILVSRSYYEVVSRLTQEYSQLFRFIGAREDKHVREHELYEVAVGGTAQDAPAAVVVVDDNAANAPAPKPPPQQPSAPPATPVTPAIPAAAATPQPQRNSTGLIIGVTAAVCLTIGLGAVLIAGKQTAPPVAEEKDKDRKFIVEDDSEPKKKTKGHKPKGEVTEVTPAPPPAPSPVAPQSGVFVNGRQITVQEAQQHQAIYNAPVQPGRYWYDPTSGLYGFWGREAIGYIRTGHAYGNAPANASNGNTGVHLNGRHLNAIELTSWQGLFRQVIQPGRYWLDGNSGNVGVEGNPTPTGNVRAAIQASRGYR